MLNTSKVSLGPHFSLGVSSLTSPDNMMLMSHMECNYSHPNGYANAKKALYNYEIKLMIFYMKTHQLCYITFLLVGKTLIIK